MWGLVISIGLAVFAAAAGGESDLQALLAAVDATRNAFDEAVISARATQILDGRETGSADFDIYVKGRDRGLIVFRGGKNSGRKVLTNGQRMWLIVPGSRNPVPITANQRLLGGASFADVARLRFSEDYVSRETGETEVAAGRSCRVLDLRAKAPAVTYPRVLLSVDGEKLPCRVRFFLSSGKEARAVTFTKFRREAGKTVVAEMEVRDLLGAASRVITRLEYRSFRSARLDEKIFTPEGARGL